MASSGQPRRGQTDRQREIAARKRAQLEIAAQRHELSEEAAENQLERDKELAKAATKQSGGGQRIFSTPSRNKDDQTYKYRKQVLFAVTVSFLLTMAANVVKSSVTKVSSG